MSAAPIAPGAVFDGKWRIEHLLGEGGMGAVYAATHVRNGARVAIKVLHAEVARDAGQRERFLQEGYAANRVGHPGVVQVLDDGTTPEGATFLVMERLEGRSLEAMAEARGGVLPLDDVLRVGLRWLEVMAAAHGQGIVHRDLKPENVFVCNDGTVKVLDFGLARVKEVVSQKRLTTTGVPLGTPAFMPPEQALAHWDQVDTRSDVYSLGASMFTLLTGQLVHDGRTVPEMLVAVSTRNARPIRTLAPTIPVAIAVVIDRALAHSPANRYRDAGEMLAALRAAAVSQFEGGRVTVGSPADAAFNGDATVQLGGAPVSGPFSLPSGAHAAAPARSQAGPIATLQLGPGRSTESPVSTGAPRRPAAGRGALVWGLAGLAVAALALGGFLWVKAQPTPPGASDQGPSPAQGASSESAAQPSEPPAVVPSVTLSEGSSGPSASSAAGVPTLSSSAAPLASASAATPASKSGAKAGARKPPPSIPTAPTAAPKPCVKDAFSKTCK